MINLNVGLKAQYKLRILNADRSLKFESDWIPNLITDLGMNRIGSQAAFGTFLRVGTGTTAPANTDTALVSQIAATNNVTGQSSVNAGAPDYQSTFSATWEFTLGAVVGNVAELGVGWTASTASTLATRSRILDGGGSPTTITVLSSEILQVTYQLTCYPSITDSVGNVTISSVVYGYTSRIFSAASVAGGQLLNVLINNVSQATAYTGAIGAITAAGPAGTSTGLTAGSLVAYTPGTYYQDYTITAAVGVGNLGGGIKSIAVTIAGSSIVWSRTQIEFSPNIPKDNTKTFSMTLRTSWARH